MPEIRITRFPLLGSEVGSGITPGVGNVAGSSPPSPPGCGVGAGPGFGAAVSATAFDLESKNTLLSKVTSSQGSLSSNQTLLKVPSAFWPEAKPKSPRSTNSDIFPLRTLSGSISLVSDPFKKLCLKLDSGQAPDSLRAGGQFRSIYPAPTDSFSKASDLSAEITLPQRVCPALEWPAPRSITFNPSDSPLSDSMANL